MGLIRYVHTARRKREGVCVRERETEIEPGVGDRKREQGGGGRKRKNERGRERKKEGEITSYYKKSHQSMNACRKGRST